MEIKNIQDFESLKIGEVFTCDQKLLKEIEYRSHKQVINVINNNLEVYVKVSDINFNETNITKLIDLIDSACEISDQLPKESETGNSIIPLCFLALRLKEAKLYLSQYLDEGEN